MSWWQILLTTLGALTAVAAIGFLDHWATVRSSR